MDFTHRSELTPGVSVSPKDQRYCDCAVNVMSVCSLKSLVGKLVQDKSLKDNTCNGSTSAAETL